MELDLRGKCAVVTGGTRNLGRAIVSAFLQEGATVLTTFREDTTSARRLILETPESTQSNLIVEKADVSSAENCRCICHLAREKFGRLDILVNNAAVILSQSPEEITDEDFDWVTHNTLRSVIYMTRAAFAVMKECGGGRIVNMSSAGVHTANPNELLYLCAKAGVEGATRSFARLGARHKITVNAIAAHVISAGMGDETLSHDPTILQRIPLGRPGTVDEFVSLTLFLSSRRCEYMTRQVLHLNGGRLMR